MIAKDEACIQGSTTKVVAGSPQGFTWLEVLRIGVAGCFIGHGAFGIITKAAWLPYFAVAGVGEADAWRLMPWIGTMDVAIGILAIAWPCRALFIWATLWAIWTALLRPLSGEPSWEFFERAGNYGVPLAILTAVGLSGPLFRVLPNRWPLENQEKHRLTWVLRFTTASLLVGHAGLGLFQKAGLIKHYAALGCGDPARVGTAVGAFEFLLAAWVIVRPSRIVLVGVCLWKLATESLFIIAGASAWEVVERFGSYTAPLALALLVSEILKSRQGQGYAKTQGLTRTEAGDLSF